jgi:catalase
MTDISKVPDPRDPPHLSTMSLTLRLVATGAIMISVAAAFALAGGWLTPQTLTPTRMVDTFEKISGPQPGFRRNHAKGVCFSGFFESNGQGVALSKASIFPRGRVSVIGRFALAGPKAFQADAPHTVRSMAILFKLPDGQEWRTGMNNTPVFSVATPRAFYEQLLAAVPDPATGKPDPAKMRAFLNNNPESAKAIALTRAAPVASGFENSTFNSLDAFWFINSDGKAAAVRWAMVPEQPFAPATAPASQPAGINQSEENYLFDALITSASRHPLRWHLMITLGQPGDPTNDATIPWPTDRHRIDVGTLTVDQIQSEENSLARDINFDPLILPAGIEPSDDPLLSARSAAYAKSFTRREGERKQPSAVSTAEVGK